MIAETLLRQAVLGSVTEAYDATEAALREVENIAPDVVGLLTTARDLLFTVRLRLDDDV